MLFCSAIVLMFFWNWKLLLATASGVALMFLVYRLQSDNWRAYLSSWSKFCHGSNRQLLIAVASGSLGSLLTYLTTSIWINSENRWLATGTILQGLTSIATLSLLSWQIFWQRSFQDETKFEQMLLDLTDSKPLKRLLAVRRLTKLVKTKSLSKVDYYQLEEYFRLMLSQEQEPLIKKTIVDSLQMWDLKELKTQKGQPLKIPIVFPPSPSSVNR